MAQTVVEQKRPRGDKSTGNLTRIERDLKAFQLHLAGCTVRGVCDELGIKSTQTAFSAIQRGREYAIERGIPTEERRLEIDQLFKETLGFLAQTARHQAEKGCEEFFVDQNGNRSMKRRPGVDPRIAGELSRSLNRWAEFCGLLERAPEVNQASTTLIQLQAPTDGASFADRWGSGNAIDVVPSAVGDTGLPAADAGPLAPSEPATAGQSAGDVVDVAQEVAQEPNQPRMVGRHRVN